MTTKNVMRIAFIVSFFSSIGSLYSVCFDNRFIPWYPHPVLKTVDKKSYFKVEGFFVTGDSTHGSPANKKKGIPELWGLFDQRVLTDASVVAGNTNRLRVAWQSAEIPWDLHGKIEGQGFNFSTEYTFGKNISIGLSTAFMHLSSNQKFVLSRDTAQTLALTASDEEELDRNRRDTLKDIGFTTDKWSYSGLADSDLFIRYGWAKDYRLKCRQANGGVKLAALLPSSKQRDSGNPASIPFGGQNMPGFLCGIDANFELKEDMWFGLIFDLSKRFKKIQTRRIPLKGEPEIFGATSGKMEIDPGVTFLFSPHVTFGDLQNGFGLGIQYLFTSHSRDVWQDKRDDKTLTIDISNISNNSKWNSEYLLFKVFYDSSRVNPEWKINPILSLSWDIPCDIFGPLDVAKTQRVGLSVEFLF